MSSATVATSVDGFAALVRSSFEANQVQGTDLRGFAVDDVVPRVMVAPSTLEQLQMVLTEAHKAGLATIPVGGGTYLGRGNVPASYDVALSLRRMNRVVAYEPADLTVTVEPGVRLADLQAQLRQSGQFLPLDPPCGVEATVGGVLASNASGPLRHAYGTARDWLIGARVVHADGTTSKSGGRVVKNVTGYDMHKLYIGSLGTLGVIAEATFKLSPMPQAHANVSVAFDSSSAATKFALGARDRGLALHAMELLSPAAARVMVDAARWHILARVAGGHAAIDRTLHEMELLASAGGASIETHADDSIWARWSDEFAPKGLSLRISVMPSAVAQTAEAIEREVAEAGALISSTVTAGVVRAQLSSINDEMAVSLIARARDVAERNDGTLVIDAAPTAVKERIDVFGPWRPDFAMMKRLKEQFDPQNLLSPGRFVGKL